jgi:protein-S-isoprenylcysteine O-methyltransferase Ste14
MAQYFLLIILWIVWCALHSALVSLSLTEPLRKRFPDASRYYRIAYNILSVVTLAPVLLYTFSLHGTPAFSWQGPWRFLQIAMAVSALFFFVAGARHYDLYQFLGLRQLKDEKACSVLTNDCSLDTSGVLNLVRHPWYAGGIFIIWARPLDTSTILTNLVLTGYFLVGTRLEERKLTAQFGQKYTDYQQRVSMLVPLKWMARRMRKKG